MIFFKLLLQLLDVADIDSYSSLADPVSRVVC